MLWYIHVYVHMTMHICMYIQIMCTYIVLSISIVCIVHLPKDMPLRLLRMYYNGTCTPWDVLVFGPEGHYRNRCSDLIMPL